MAEFPTNRSTGSRLGSYDLPVHLIDKEAHPQYLLKQAMTREYVMEVIDQVVVNGVVLYHDPLTDASSEHAASMKAANVVAESIFDHNQAFEQTATATNHLDTTGLELYAHRLHTHEYADLSGVAAADHNHDGVYQPAGDYITSSDLSNAGIYPTSYVIAAEIYLSDEDDASSSSADDDSSSSPTDDDGASSSSTEPEVFDFNEYLDQGNQAVNHQLFAIGEHCPYVYDLTMPAQLEILTTIYGEISSDTVDENYVTTYPPASYLQSILTAEGYGVRVGTLKETTLDETDDIVNHYVSTGWRYLMAESTFWSHCTNPIQSSFQEFEASAWTWNSDTEQYELTLDLTEVHSISQVYQRSDTDESVITKLGAEVTVEILSDTPDNTPLDRTVKLSADTSFKGFLRYLRRVK